MFIKLTLNHLFCDGMMLDVGSCREAGEGDEHGGEDDEGDGVLYEVHEGSEVFHILHVGSGEGFVKIVRITGNYSEKEWSVTE